MKRKSPRLFFGCTIVLFIVSGIYNNAVAKDRTGRLHDKIFKTPHKDTSKVFDFFRHPVVRLHLDQYKANAQTPPGTVNYIAKYTATDVLGNSIIYDNGTQIGIGTTSPAYTLDVKGTTRIGGTTSGIGNALEIWNLGANIFSFNNSGALDLFSSSLRIGTGTIGAIGSNPTISKTDATKYLSLAGALYVAPQTNNILINTTTDNGYKLDVLGSVRMGYGFDNNKRKLVFTSDNTSEDALLVSTPTDVGANINGYRYAPLSTNSGWHRGFVVSFPVITASNSQNVGFDIEATVGATATITGVRSVVSRTGSTASKISYAGYFSSTTDMGAAYSIYSAAGLNYFADNVGIGVTGPTSKLQVNGTVRLQALTANNTLNRILVSDNDGNLSYRDASSLLPAGGGNTFNGTANYLARYASPTEIVNSVIYETGSNVGIGTTTPGTYKLAVEGTIGARKVKVTQTTPWADYVFEPGYRLRDLNDLEKFINQHKHLPEVPTAAEVEKNGIDLGDNQVTLLKKVEELTLYVISLNKEITALKEELKRTKK